MMSNSVWNQFRATWLTTIFSLILFLAVTYLLHWNERQAILNTKSLNEASEYVTSINPFDSVSKIDFEGKLIHIIGPIDIMEPLTEPDYNIQVMSVKLKKRVQMYQWIEEATEKDAFGDSLSSDDINTYTYYKEWRDYVVDSSLFYMTPGHHNPRDMPISGQTYIAENVKIGGIFLGPDIKKKFSDYYDITSDERPDRQDIKLHSGAYYHAADSLVHEIGDLRVMFSYAGRQDDEYSAIGMLKHGILLPYVTANQEHVVLLQKGRHPSADMIYQEFKESNMLVWRYRAVGWFQMFAAAMSLHPDWFSLLLSSPWVSPQLRGQGRLKTNLIIATCITLTVISTAWIFYSPVISFTLFVVSISPLIYFSNFLKRNTRP